jgi:hypothetical protein
MAMMSRFMTVPLEFVAGPGESDECAEAGKAEQEHSNPHVRLPIQSEPISATINIAMLQSTGHAPHIAAVSMKADFASVT